MRTILIVLVSQFITLPVVRLFLGFDNFGYFVRLVVFAKHCLPSNCFSHCTHVVSSIATANSKVFETKIDTSLCEFCNFHFTDKEGA